MHLFIHRCIKKNRNNRVKTYISKDKVILVRIVFSIHYWDIRDLKILFKSGNYSRQKKIIGINCYF